MPLLLNPGLHELDPLFRKVTLENDRLKSLVRDLKFHHDPVGTYFLFPSRFDSTYNIVQHYKAW
jgi:hypothetical protein